MTTIEVRARARSDVAEAVAWYESVAPEQVGNFTWAVEECLQRIEKLPALPRVFYKDVRMVMLKTFPFQVWYRYAEKQDLVTVLRITHARRDRASVLSDI